MTNLTPTGLPLGFHEWLPVAQAATLGLLTFVQEDVPTVSAALLVAAGVLNLEAGFLGVFLGIWMGDALLYVLARGVGRPLLHRSWARGFLDPAAVARSEQWFEERGSWLLLSSRFVPGTRLPTYLAAGFLRLPFTRFLLVTGLAVAMWTVGIFMLASTFGPALLNGLQSWNSGGLAVLALTAATVFAVRCARKLVGENFGRRARAVVGRWLRWEFWPPWLFYLPVALNYIRLAICFRGFTLPTAANPGIFSGGFVGESKIATLRDLWATSPKFTAQAYLLEGATPSERQASLHHLRGEHGIDYPFILKPDVGQRGVGVKLIRTPEQAADYLRRTCAPLVLQRYAPGPHEAGVFYYRLPHEPRGHIFAITEKIFPVVTGDGRRTIEELVWAEDRARFLAETYLERFGPRRAKVLPAGEPLKLVEAGNHAQGCIFRDGAHLWSEELEQRIDEISQRLPGFFIGRYDIRYAVENDLRTGRAFQIIELNGAASEATSIYDARNSLFSAYRTLFRQWELVFAIGAANRQRGTAPTKPTLLWRTWRETAALLGTYPPAD
jgi:membrane protein DedA with SNARE-associated domain